MSNKNPSTQDELRQMVARIADEITNEALDEEGKTQSANDYLQDVLDIEYIIGADMRYLGARILVTFGGPNIWINTRTNTVEGYWWTEEAFAGFTDNLGLDDVLEEQWDASKPGSHHSPWAGR